MMKRILSYLVAAMILSVSSVAMVAALLARDVFGQKDPYVALALAALVILYFVFLLLLDRLQSNRPDRCPRRTQRGAGTHT